ncbi:MAG: cytosine permease [Actinomycetota bacterium]|nr:cytosine permease [Actinomycetota bacterium]
MTTPLTRSTATDPDIEAALASYGSKAVAVEPGGVEVIPPEARHGRASGLLWTWTSPNLEFATVGVGILGVLYWGLSFWQCVAAIVVGSALGSISHALLSTWGPESGLCQMVLSRLGFGFLGNILPAGINAVVAGIGWFAVNSVSGALALHALVTGLPSGVCLVIVVALMLLLAVAGHNLVHAFERYVFPVLAVIFVIGLIVVLSKSHPSAPGTGGTPTTGAFLLMVGASFGYAAGWNPYASDYTRYLPAAIAKAPVALFAGLGVFVPCVLLELGGAAMVTAVGSAAAKVDPGVYTGLMPGWIGKLTLLAIAVGSIAANALNVYSGSMSFMALGIKLPTRLARASVAAVFALIGLVVAFTGLKNAGVNYEAFLLVIAYWIGPWLGVVFANWVVGRHRDVLALATDTKYRNWAGPIAMLVAMVVSIWLFSNQQKYVGIIPKHVPAFGDITFFVGFLLAAGLYLLLSRLLPTAGRAIPGKP